MRSRSIQLSDALDILCFGFSFHQKIARQFNFLMQVLMNAVLWSTVDKKVHLHFFARPTPFRF